MRIQNISNMIGYTPLLIINDKKFGAAIIYWIRSYFYGDVWI